VIKAAAGFAMLWAAMKIGGAAIQVARNIQTAARAVGALNANNVKYIARVPAMIAANTALCASFAVVAIGVYAIVKAYQAWQEAAAQAREAAANSAAADQGAKEKAAAWQTAHPGQALPAGYQKLQDYSNQNPADYQAPTNTSGWLGSWYDYMSTSSSLAPILPKFAGGGVAKAPKAGGLAVLHGVERITPVDEEQPTLAFNHCTFVGTSRDAARTLTTMVNRNLGRRVAGLQRGRYAGA
jgi:hypothetical protein